MNYNWNWTKLPAELFRVFFGWIGIECTIG
jgi:hypothetical protein